MQNIKCGNKVHDKDVSREHYHWSVDEVRECYSAPKGILSIQEEVMAYEDEQAARAEWEAEMAYERHLEDAGWAEAAHEQDREAAMGILSFADQWDMESPGTRAGYVG